MEHASGDGSAIGRIAKPCVMAEYPPALIKKEEQSMWRKPVMTEICTGAEINSYISAAKK
jgi:coenzyme PQQ precursor peptide PqqA